MVMTPAQNPYQFLISDNLPISLPNTLPTYRHMFPGDHGARGMGQIWGVARMARIVSLLANHYQRVGKNGILFIEAVGARCIVPLQMHPD
jgi:hypothetical protein